MNTKQNNLTQDELKRLLSYDLNTGNFTWNISKKGINLDKSAGSIHANDGYCRIRIDGVPYSAHRLAWLYVHGSWPKVVIDHIDGDRSNNRLSNLREATLRQNQFNRKVKCTSSTGVKGVSLDRRGKRFQVQIKIEGVKKFIGYFNTISEGAAAYNAIAKTIHGQFFRA
jgi:hypothetical protein